jgi:lipoprotein signal peptidase
MALSNMIDKIRKEIFIDYPNSEIYLFDKFSKSILK